MDITEFPNEIFLIINSYLNAEDIIRCRCVCQKWHSTFTNADLCRHILMQRYPCAREVRLASSTTTNWSLALSAAACRYHHLRRGTPRYIERLLLSQSLVVPAWARHYGVGTWQRYLAFENKTAPFHYPDTLWTYDDGLLVFPSAKEGRYMLHDLAKGSMCAICFDPEGKIVRRMRLKERVLVVEWCEGQPYHQLNENEAVSRHFATAYDVVLSAGGAWATEFRSEWKIHFLGLPLNARDRFYSSHTASHYALYLWQPARSPWGEDLPLETLTVWDISTSHPYCPSGDPTGQSRPLILNSGPKVIKRLNYADLAFYGIRQNNTPRFRVLQLDDENVYVVEEDHRWLVGSEVGDALPRLHKVRCVGLPFGMGPRWEDECGVDGDVDLSFCERKANGDGMVRRVGRAPCWRHEDFPYLTITEAVDVEAGVRYTARHCFMLESISISVKPRVHVSSVEFDVPLKDDMWQELLGKGKICGDERWLIGENGKREVVVMHFDRDG